MAKSGHWNRPRAVLQAECLNHEWRHQNDVSPAARRTLEQQNTDPSGALANPVKQMNICRSTLLLLALLLPGRPTYTCITSNPTNRSNCEDDKVPQLGSNCSRTPHSPVSIGVLFLQQGKQAHFAPPPSAVEVEAPEPLATAHHSSASLLLHPNRHRFHCCHFPFLREDLVLALAMPRCQPPGTAYSDRAAPQKPLTLRIAAAVGVHDLCLARAAEFESEMQTLTVHCPPHPAFFRPLVVVALTM